MAAHGCVWPGEIDTSLVGRYQRAMSRRAPAKRAGEKGTDLISPIGRTTRLPDLEVTKDPKTGRMQVRLDLDQAVQRALANNLEIMVVSFDPAISREEMIQAAAEFDFIVFGGYNYAKEDNRTDSVFQGGERTASTWNAGVGKKTTTGAEMALEWTWSHSWSDLTVQTLRTRYEQTLEFQVTQPLLRDGGRGVTLATLRVARLNHKQSLAAFRAQVEEIVALVIATYWRLIQARLDERIQQALLDRTVETLDRIKKRADVDATAVQIKQAEAAVESRRAGLIRANKIIFDVQDALGQLLSDKQINLLGTYELIPVTDPIRVKVNVSAVDQLVTALAHNAELAQARLAIAVADINVRVAKNQTLPRLDLRASTGLQGLGATSYASKEQLNSGDYASYTIGISLEYPIGNRAANAELRKRRFERLKAITTMQNVADKVAVVINERVRQMNATFEEMRAQRAAVAAAKVQLQALEDTERIRGRLTPEFLQTKLAAQETLAAAERAELQATIDYNTARTDLARTVGTILNQHRVKLENTFSREDLAGWKVPAKAKPEKR